uniref:Dynein regulatory complex subunit 4 n=1 Tax=Xiphophorus couchianus TaxID=32473 RepID=A0A3B5M0T9_9TELE
QPPKKDEKKKKAEAKPPTLINGLTKEEISREQIEDHVVRLREVLDREREERNYFQLERDKIQSFREVTDRKHSEVKAELKNLEKAIEDDQAHHLVGIKVFKQKMKHLLCEHHNTVTELEADIVTSTDVLEDEQSQLEADLYKEMMGILVEMQESSCEDVFKELLLVQTAVRNKTEIQQLEKEHDNIMKSVTCERELLWKSHFGNLNEDIERCISDAKELISMLSRDTVKEITALKLFLTFVQLQIEVEELQSSVPKKIDIAQKQADLSLMPLEDELTALNDHVEQIQAQLHALISAPNVDQTAVTEITHKVEVMSPADPAPSVRLHPQQAQCHQMSPSSMGDQSAGDTGRFENRIDILGVINMIQIFTLFTHIAESCDLPVTS